MCQNAKGFKGLLWSLLCILNAWRAIQQRDMLRKEVITGCKRLGIGVHDMNRDPKDPNKILLEAQGE